MFSYQRKKINFLRYIIGLSAVITFVYCCINIQDDSSYSQAIVELCVSIVAFTVFCFIPRWTLEFAQKFAIILSNMLCIYLLFILYQEGINTTSYVWLLAIPITSYLLTGVKQGMITTSINFVIIMIMMLLMSNNSILHISVESILDLLLPYLWVWALAHFYENNNTKFQDMLLDLAQTDALTKLYNRHAFYNSFNKNNATPVSVLVLDIDFFKHVNDTYGHDAGDYVLKQTAKILLKFKQQNGEVFRMGGEEFVILLPSTTLQEAISVAEQILIEIRKQELIFDKQIIKITTSIGVASCQEKCIVDKLVSEADQYLYQAKHDGRDCVKHKLIA